VNLSIDVKKNFFSFLQRGDDAYFLTHMICSRTTNLSREKHLYGPPGSQPMHDAAPHSQRVPPPPPPPPVAAASANVTPPP
jgi:hypothetical protein